MPQAVSCEYMQRTHVSIQQLLVVSACVDHPLVLTTLRGASFDALLADNDRCRNVESLLITQHDWRLFYDCLS